MYETDKNEEPSRFTWFRDGEPVTGTLEQWARMWEGDYYAGEQDLSRVLLYWDSPEAEPVKHLVEVERYPVDEEYKIRHKFTVPGRHDVSWIFIHGDV